MGSGELLCIHVAPSLEKEGHRIGKLSSGRTPEKIFMGYWAGNFGNKPKNFIWLGFQVLPSAGNQYRTCYVVHVKCSDKTRADEVTRAYGDFTNSRKSEIEFFLLKPLAHLVATANQEDQANALNTFFTDSLKKLKDAGVFDIVYK